MRSRKQGSSLSSTLLWSVISAAFIGPGTVATAGKAGADFGASLLWAVLLSIIATLVLQEAAARITITTGKNLGTQIRERCSRVPALPILIWLSIAFGCAAYEAGNILGAVAGLQIVFPGDGRIYSVGIFLIALMLLRSDDPKRIAQILGGLVFMMGFAFLIVATQTSLSFREVISGGITPSLSGSASLLIIGLIGTTIVPYNLFLGSRLGAGQSLREMRRGLIPAVLFGGIITMSIVLTGTLVQGNFQYSGLATALTLELGNWAGILFGLGLFAAGLTSAVTAPLAAAITAQSIIPACKDNSRWYRTVWLIVLSIGLIMGLLELRPIPVIIAAQAINGVLLPVIAFFLFIIAFPVVRSSDKSVPYWLSGLALCILATVSFLGIYSVLTAAHKSGMLHWHDQRIISTAAVCACIIAIAAIVTNVRWSSREKRQDA
jgi:Mn2+/Fe2+ NRAMP family transporter